jgi:hypothetical protein
LLTVFGPVGISYACFSQAVPLAWQGIGGFQGDRHG